jgi:probable F420-dependent oxidoreductase
VKVETNLRETPLANISAEAKQAEALGFDGLNASENQHNPFFPLVLAAEHTQSLSLGTSVAIAFPRSPMITAYAAWDLQSFSRGRFLLGLGTQVKGHNERRFAIAWSPPGPRLRDYIGALRAIWACWQNGVKLDFESKHYRINLMTPNFNPGPIEHPRIPVHIAAINPYLSRLAGELCDGLRLHGFSTPLYIRSVIMTNVEEGLRASGRDRSAVTITGGGFLATGWTDEEVEQGREVARRRIAFYGSTRTYHPVLAVHGWTELGEDLHQLSLRGQWDEMARRIPDEVVDAFTTSGTYDQIAARLRERFAGLVDALVFTAHPRDARENERLQALLSELKSIPTAAAL